MRISDEGKIGIGLGLLFGFGGGAVMVAPEQVWIGWTLMGISVIGGMALAIHHFSDSLWLQQRRRMLALAGMIVTVAGFFASAAWYFWPAANPMPPITAVADPLDNTIKVDCSWSAPPSRYREDKTLYVIDFQGVPENGMKYTGQVAGPASFRRSSDSFKPSPYASDYWYRCDVQNLGAKAVRNVRIQFPTVFLMVEKTDNGTKSGVPIGQGYATSPGLDLAPNETDYFYFANSSPAFLNVLVPPLATLQTIVDDVVHTVKLVPVSGMKRAFALMPSPTSRSALPQVGR